MPASSGGAGLAPETPEQLPAVQSPGGAGNLTDKDLLEGDKDREALEPDNLLEVRFREGIVSRVSPGN